MVERPAKVIQQPIPQVVNVKPERNLLDDDGSSTTANQVYTQPPVV